jgi:ribosome-binding factor A
MGDFRLIRLGGQIRDEISKMIAKQTIKDPRVSTFLSINLVELSGDLGFAKVYVSSFMDDAQTEKGVKGLQSAAKKM